ncbi:MAG: hypothetical protein ACK4OE_17560 [Acidovorax sp.]|uniref:hypothetical protein n=1 Tax=Acidovorax sp. TaxID=1872122 RepID=UPI00391B4783
MSTVPLRPLAASTPFMSRAGSGGISQRSDNTASSATTLTSSVPDSAAMGTPG